jgi:hypothetical protein
MHARIAAGVVAALLAVTLVSCTNDPDPGPSPTPTPTADATTTTPTPTRDANTVDLTGTSAQLTVGQRLYVAGYDTEKADFLRADSSAATVLAKVDDRTFEAKAAGTATLTIETYFHDCPNGPCAHPNAPVEAAVTVTQ